MNNVNKKDKATNPDLITGAPGSHPVGTGLGAVAGGAAAGAAVGTVAGPAGTIAGAAVGAIVGGLAGKGIAEKVNPTAEDAYWRKEHAAQPYANGRDYNDYVPAYRIGYEGYSEMAGNGASFDHSEAELRRRYEQDPSSSLAWNEAKPATRAAWERLNKRTTSAKTV
jgi:uncharacterized protein YcfJ